MKKSSSIIKISVISVLTALLLVFSFISFDGFTGFYNATKRSLELKEGIYANYTVVRDDELTDKEFAEKYDNTFLKINSLIEQKNYQGSVVYKGTRDTIRIESPKVEDSLALLTEIGAGLLKIRKSDKSDDEVYISGDDVMFAVATTSPQTGYWGTYIQFTEESSQILTNITENASENSPTYLYFYRGNSDSYFFSLPVGTKLKSDYLVISSSTGGITQADAINLAITVSCGSMPAVVEMQGQVMEIQAINGAMLGVEIAIGVTLLIFLIALAVIYRELGFMVGLSLLFYVGLMMLLVQSIPLITVGVESLGAILLGLILVVIFNVIILEKIKEDFAMGRKLNIAVRSGYKKSMNLIADISGVFTIISLISFFICTGMLKSFMMMLLTSSIVSCVVALGVSYILFVSYATFNSNNGKRVNFVRQEMENENE